MNWLKVFFSEEAKNTTITIIERLKNEGAQGVILGCTELPMLLPEALSPLPSFDTLRLHVEAAIDFALN